MATKTTGLLYTKTYPTKKGTSFTKYLFKSSKGNTYTATLGKNVKNLINYEGWNFPQSITLDDEDYFMKKNTFTDKNGEIRDSYEIVITSIFEHEQAKFESIHLEDIEK